MQAVQLQQSGDAFAHYEIDDHAQFERDIQWHGELRLSRFASIETKKPEPAPDEDG